MEINVNPTNFAIDGFENLSQQQMFDISAAHLLQTGQKSYSEENEACSYSGSGCAAAPFLKEEFRKVADNKGIWSNLVYFKNVPENHSYFVEKLQHAHDRANGFGFLEDWKVKMREVATQFELDDSILDKEATNGN
jgi:hypothetical protein